MAKANQFNKQNGNPSANTRLNDHPCRDVRSFNRSRGAAERSYDLHTQVQEVLAATPMVFTDPDHPVAARSYKRFTTAELDKLLRGARIVARDKLFETFTLLVGYHREDARPFVCIQSTLAGDLHLMLDCSVEKGA